MSANQYIIRNSAMGYDDEVYYDVGHTIHDVYSDKTLAELNLRKLQIGRVKEIPLGEAAMLFNGPDGLVEKVDEYIKDKTGESVLDGGDYIEQDVELPEGLSDNDIIELGTMIDTLGFDLVELSGDQMLHVLWDIEEDEPYKTFDEAGEFLVYGPSEDNLVSEAEEEINFALDEYFEADGSYEDLSDSPELLKSFVESTEGCSYDDQNPGINIDDELSAGAIKSLNGLLKRPFYSVKKMSVADVMALENTMSGY